MSEHSNFQIFHATGLHNEEYFGVVNNDGKKVDWIFEPKLKSALDAISLSAVELNFPPSLEDHVTITGIYAVLCPNCIMATCNGTEICKTLGVMKMIG